jgi:hypothetical protein
LPARAADLPARAAPLTPRVIERLAVPADARTIAQAVAAIGARAQ